MLSNEEAECLQVGDMPPVRKFLKEALELKYVGDVHHYRHLVAQLHQRDDSETVFRVYIGLCSCVGLLTSRQESYRDLFVAIFSYDWSMEPRMNIAFTNLLGQLVSYNTMFLIPSLEALVKTFASASQHQGEQGGQVAQQDPGTQALQQKSKQSSWALSERMARIHRTLQGLITLVPTGQAELLTVIANHYPHSRFDKLVLTDYVTQLLHLCEYLPVMQPRILDLVVRKCLEIDVEIVIEEGEDGEDGQVKLEGNNGGSTNLEEYAEDREDIFQLDVDDDAMPTQSSHPQRSFAGIIPTVGSSSLAAASRQGQCFGPGEEGSMRIAPEVVELSNKLDAKLLILIQFIDAQISRGAEEKSRILFQLIAVFEDRILVTHKSKFVQFALFFTGLRVDRFAIMLCDRLLHSFRDTTATHLVRETSVMYLASFCARSTFLPPQTFIGVLDELMTWAKAAVGTTAGAIAGMSSSSSSSSVIARESTGVNNSMDGMTDDSGGADEYESESDGVRGQGRRRRHDKSSTALTLSSADETFICCVQAMCYMLCFLGTDVASYHASAAGYQATWNAILDNPLHPLAGCIATVRAEFCRLAENTGLLSADALQHIAEAKPVTSSTSSTITLDAFFPFDPCLLRMTNACVCGGYRSWKGIPGVDYPSDGRFVPQFLGAGSVHEGKDGYHSNDHDYDYDCMDSDSVSSSMVSSASSAMGTSMHYDGRQQMLNAHAAAFTPGAHWPATSYDSVSAGSDGNGSQHVGSTPSGSVHENGSYQSNDPQQVWPLPMRRPRNFSVGSAGSW